MQLMMSYSGISGAETQSTLTHYNTPKKLLKEAALDLFSKEFFTPILVSVISSISAEFLKNLFGGGEVECVASRKELKA